jgi:hypothetical protein
MEIQNTLNIQLDHSAVCFPYYYEPKSLDSLGTSPSHDVTSICPTPKYTSPGIKRVIVGSLLGLTGTLFGAGWIKILDCVSSIIWP